MAYDYEGKKRKQISLMRTISNFGMGVFLLLAGLFFLLHKALKIDFANFPPSGVDKFLGVLFVVYGSWRLYRGCKYFKNN